MPDRSPLPRIPFFVFSTRTIRGFPLLRLPKLQKPGEFLTKALSQSIFLAIMPHRGVPVCSANTAFVISPSGYLACP